MSEELKPCPFCGEAPFASLADHSGTIACQTTDCAFVEADRGQSAEAVRVWNRRAADAEIAKLRARVAQMSRDYDERQALAEVIDPGGSMCNETTGQSLSDVVRDLRARVAALQAEVDACGDIIGQPNGATFGHAEMIEETIHEHQADNVKLAARVAELERGELRWTETCNDLRAQLDASRYVERHDAALTRAHAAEARVAELEREGERMREALLSFTALDWGCPSGDCPHSHKDQCNESTAALLREVAEDARAALAPRAEEKP